MPTDTYVESFESGFMKAAAELSENEKRADIQQQLMQLLQNPQAQHAGLAGLAGGAAGYLSGADEDPAHDHRWRNAALGAGIGAGGSYGIEELLKRYSQSQGGGSDAPSAPDPMSDPKIQDLIHSGDTPYGPSKPYIPSTIRMPSPDLSKVNDPNLSVLNDPHIKALLSSGQVPKHQFDLSQVNDPSAAHASHPMNSTGVQGFLKGLTHIPEHQDFDTSQVNDPRLSAISKLQELFKTGPGGGPQSNKVPGQVFGPGAGMKPLQSAEPGVMGLPGAKPSHVNMW